MEQSSLNIEINFVQAMYLELTPIWLNAIRANAGGTKMAAPISSEKFPKDFVTHFWEA
jgi:hypothetical protein